MGTRRLGRLHPPLGSSACPRTEDRDKGDNSAGSRVAGPARRIGERLRATGTTPFPGVGGCASGTTLRSDSGSGRDVPGPHPAAEVQGAGPAGDAARLVGREARGSRARRCQLARLRAPSGCARRPSVDSRLRLRALARQVRLDPRARSPWPGLGKASGGAGDQAPRPRADVGPGVVRRQQPVRRPADREHVGSSSRCRLSTRGCPADTLRVMASRADRAGPRGPGCDPGGLRLHGLAPGVLQADRPLDRVRRGQ